MGFILSGFEKIILFTARREAKKRGVDAAGIDEAVTQIKNMDFSFLKVGTPEPEKLYFAKDKNGFNASAAFTNSIVLARGWLHQFALHPEDEVAKSALRALVGHEHAHHIAYWEPEFFQSAADDAHRGPRSKSDSASHPSGISRVEYVRTGSFAEVRDQVIAQAEAYINRNHPGKAYRFPDALRAKMITQYPNTLLHFQTKPNQLTPDLNSQHISRDRKFTLREIKNITYSQKARNSKSLFQKQKLSL